MKRWGVMREGGRPSCCCGARWERGWVEAKPAQQVVEELVGSLTPTPDIVHPLLE